jgi:hypothetical protein
MYNGCTLVRTSLSDLMSIPSRSNVLPENRCRCENLQSEAKGNLAQVLSMATDWSPPLIAKAYQPSFAWCCRHGANRMEHLSQKVVTFGIACNTICRKWGPTSVSQPPKTFDGSTSASVSLRSVEPSCKSPFEDQLPNLIDTVRNS